MPRLEQHNVVVKGRTTHVYSDDHGETWHLPDGRMIDKKDIGCDHAGADAVGAVILVSAAVGVIWFLCHVLARPWF